MEEGKNQVILELFITRLFLFQYSILYTKIAYALLFYKVLDLNCIIINKQWVIL